MGERTVAGQAEEHLDAVRSFPAKNDEPEAVMLKSTLAALLSITASASFGQTEVAPPPAPAAPAAPGAAEPARPLPRCSATVRDRCLQDERFARDVPNPNGSRDNNALNYPTPEAAKRARPTH